MVATTQTIPENARVFAPVYTRRQSLARDALLSPHIKKVMYGGAKGGGKSAFACLYAMRSSIQICKDYNIPRSDDPIQIGFMGRKVGKDFRETTLATWKKMIPSSLYRLKGNPAEIIIDERVKILTGGLERVEEKDKFNSAEFAFGIIDQAEETTRNDVLSLEAATFGRLVLDGRPVPGKVLYTANPRQCWLKPHFITHPEPGCKYIQALPGDNPYLGQQYVDNLAEIFKHRPELIQAYLYGNWDALEGADQVIKDTWIRDAMQRTCEQPVTKRYLVCDPARFGDDECVIDLMNNIEIEDQEVLPYCRTTEISSRLGQLSEQNNKCEIVVESVGADLGAGVIDELVANGRTVYQFNPAAKAMNPDIHRNLRAEAWCKTAEVLSCGIVDRFTSTLAVCNNMDDDTRTQLCIPTYSFRPGGAIQIESKADIKTRFGRSPDKGDTYVIAVWAWPMIRVESTSDWTHRHGKKGHTKAPMSM